VGFQTHQGQKAVRGSDAIAWPEVLFKGFGWVAFDPLPKSDTVQRPVEDDFKPKAPPSQPPPPSVPPPSVSASAAAGRSASASAVAQPPAPSRGPLVALSAGVATVVLIVGFFAAVPVVLSSRRRKRFATGPPAARIDAAWSEILLGLRQAGRPAPGHLTAAEVARYAESAAEPRAHAGRVLRPAVPVAEVAALVNESAFAGHAGLSDAHAAQATRQAAAYLGDLKARRPWWRRLLWTFDPRPLRWVRRGTPR
jgi:hypothetical protein